MSEIIDRLPIATPAHIDAPLKKGENWYLDMLIERGAVGEAPKE